MLEGPRPCTIFCFAFIHYMDYVTETFLLVSSSVSSEATIVFCVRSRPKKTTKTYWTKNFVEFHNHSPLLTMVARTTFRSFGLNSVHSRPHFSRKNCGEDLQGSSKIFIKSLVSLPRSARIVRFLVMQGDRGSRSLLPGSTKNTRLGYVSENRYSKYQIITDL